ncbi:GIY-YIG nuclease family protein [Anditalea andensis]|uniref:Bacteriophage T5 Orf172 DNA-binding domain-containing protein n=1 Tax=Anditalea andensis TaxID=1048983 RepID=A0A074KSK9_9BACT|nr:GIY-YIG nuclease family protein [Anditalea andensis]KEO72946.1 hypothetical protein EL17_15100 [Anditalea andensis]
MQHRKKYTSLDEIFNDEEFHLIEEKKKTSSYGTPDNRLLASFHQINDFFAKNGRTPEANISNVSEYQLYSRLRSIREDPVKVEMLQPEDVYNLLQEVENFSVHEPREEYKRRSKKEIKSIGDILDDDLDIFGDDEGLFEFKHTPKVTTMPDYVGSRKPCADFEDFDPLLKSCQSELKEGKRRIKDFKNEQQIDVGYFFVLNGLLLYVAEVEERKQDKSGKTNARLRCIFENGTESDMLLRSLAAELYKNGRRITENHVKINSEFHRSLGAITEDDKESGFIYVLKSKSKREELASLDNLYKIGYSRTEVAERIKHAAKEPTYLMAEVDYVAGWKCYNMNTQKFEQLIHNFFGSSCLNIDVFDEKGKRYTPREWFIAPYEVIEEVIGLIISGEVVKYRYDGENETIVKR